MALVPRVYPCVRKYITMSSWYKGKQRLKPDVISRGFIFKKEKKKKKKKSSPMWPLLRSTTWWMWVLPEDHKFPTHDHVTHWTRDGVTLEICCPSLLHLFSIKMTNSPKQHQCQTLKAWSQIYNSARAFTHQTRDVHVLFVFSHSVLTFPKGHGRVRSKEE